MAVIVVKELQQQFWTRAYDSGFERFGDFTVFHISLIAAKYNSGLHQGQVGEMVLSAFKLMGIHTNTLPSIKLLTRG